MNTWVEAPPPKKGLGCFARGCLILLVFAIVLAIACFAGVFWGLQRHSAIVHGIYWLSKTHSVSETPVPVPEFAVSDAQIQNTWERWQDFEQRARAGQPAEIELSADDLNSLMAMNPDARGKVFASIEGNRLRLQVSVPLGELLSRPGYYFNGDITIESKGAQSLDNPQLSRVLVNDEAIPKDFFRWKYRSRRLRDYLSDYRNRSGIGTVEIRDGKLILRSHAD